MLLIHLTDDMESANPESTAGAVRTTAHGADSRQIWSWRAGRDRLTDDLSK
jgi:hypothetical protein